MPSAPLEAVLFDMDGLLVDTEPVWTVAEEELCRQLGGRFLPQLKAAIVGTRLDVAVPAILRWCGAPDRADEIAKTSNWLLNQMVELLSARPPVLPGAEDLLSRLQEEGVPVALVSSSYRVLVDAVLAHGIGSFHVTVSGDEVSHGKPHPAPYHQALAALGATAQHCVVLEDSPAGVTSGEAAGCAVVAVPSVTGVEFGPASRRLVVPSLTTVDVGTLRALVN